VFPVSRYRPGQQERRLVIALVVGEHVHPGAGLDLNDPKLDLGMIAPEGSVTLPRIEPRFS